MRSYRTFPSLLRQPVPRHHRLCRRFCFTALSPKGGGAVYLCCTFPEVAFGGRYPLSLPCGARTFLIGGLSACPRDCLFSSRFLFYKKAGELSTGVSKTFRKMRFAAQRFRIFRSLSPLFFETNLTLPPGFPACETNALRLQPFAGGRKNVPQRRRPFLLPLRRPGLLEEYPWGRASC